MEEQKLLLSGACQFEDWVGSQIVGFCVVRLFVHCGCWVVRFLVGVKSVVVGVPSVVGVFGIGE